MVTQIEAFLDELYGADFLFNTEEDEYNETVKQLDNLENNLYKIAEAMREDLGIDSLGKKLKKRIRN